MITSSAVVDGRIVKVGDCVCFKSDFEQCAEIVEIKRHPITYKHMLVLGNDDGFAGEYIEGETRHTVAAADCWVE
jgi:hypothetical protein